jgi:FAD/FMN-containing dehydrogenase
MTELIKNGAAINEPIASAEPISHAGIDPGPTGSLLNPGDPGWDEARTPWVINVDQRPAAVALVRSVDDVSAVVTGARRNGLKVMAQSTGHAALPVGDLNHTVLVRTAALNDIHVDPAERTVWAGSGTDWQAATAAVAKHGLAVQTGSAPDVGIAGFLLSGGLSWLSRSRGLAVNDVLTVQVVGADGIPRVVDHDHDSDIFWAVRGGGGGFGVVTGFELRLHELPTVSAGTLFFPMPRAGEVLHAWRRWTRTVSKRTMSCGRLLQFPPLPELPDPLRARPLPRSKSRIRETSQSWTQLLRRFESWDLAWTQSPRSRQRGCSLCIWIRLGRLRLAATGCCSTTYRQRRSTRSSPAPVTDRDRRSCRWSFDTSAAPLPSARWMPAPSVTWMPSF